MAKDKDKSGSVDLKKTRPDNIEKCPECGEKCCDHSLDDIKTHFNTVIRKIREGKIVH